MSMITIMSMILIMITIMIMIMRGIPWDFVGFRGIPWDFVALPQRFVSRLTRSPYTGVAKPNPPETVRICPVVYADASPAK